MKKFENYYKENKFSGATNETKPVVDLGLLSKYYYKYGTSDFAVEILKEKNKRHSPKKFSKHRIKRTHLKILTNLQIKTKNHKMKPCKT